MGWTTIPSYNRRSDRKAFIRDRVKEQSAHDKTGVIGKYTCLKHCLRGNVLWTVWEISYHDKSKESVIFIGCDLIGFYGLDGWGYKDMCESSHPFYYSCPMSYLEMAPVACEEWRKNVRKYHSISKMKVGDTFKISDGRKAEVVKSRPLIASIEGFIYRVRKSQVLLSSI